MTLGSVGGTRVGVGLRYAVEQQAVASAVLFQGVHLVGERLVVAVEGSQLALHGRHRGNIKLVNKYLMLVYLYQIHVIITRVCQVSGM